MRQLWTLLVVTACAGSGAHSGSSRSPNLKEPFDDGAVCPVPTVAMDAGVEARASEAPTGTDGGLLLKNARLIDGSGAKPREGVDVLVNGAKIVEIGKGLTAPAGARTIDVGGRALLPGFIDAHTHITFDPPKNYEAGVARSVKETDADRVLRGVRNARATLVAGFTTVRNVGGTLADRALRDAIAAGHVPGPRMLVANHSIGISGGHCDGTNTLHPQLWGEPPDFRRGVADGPDEVRKAVRYQIKQGADVIKICATGGVLSQGDGVGAPQLTPEEMSVIVSETVRAERKVAAHAHGNHGIREAVRAGVHSIEHGSILDEQTVAMMKRRGTFLVPTAYVAEVVERKADEGVISAHSAAKAREIAPKMRRSFKLAYDRGVKIALGTDAGVFPHGENAKEFSTMVGLGMKPMDAIVSATKNGAELLGLDNVGQIKAGFLADIVVVDGDPLEDISVLAAPVLVMKGGAIHVAPAWAAPS